MHIDTAVTTRCCCWSKLQIMFLQINIYIVLKYVLHVYYTCSYIDTAVATWSCLLLLSNLWRHKLFPTSCWKYTHVQFGELWKYKKLFSFPPNQLNTLHRWLGNLQPLAASWGPNKFVFCWLETATDLLTNRQFVLQTAPNPFYSRCLDFMGIVPPLH